MLPAEKFDRTQKASNFYGVEEWEDTNVDPLLSSTGLIQAMSENEIHLQLQNYKEFVNLEDLYVDVVPPPCRPCDDRDEMKKTIGSESRKSELIECMDKGSSVFSMAPFKILMEHGRKLKLLDGGRKSNVDSQIQSVDTEKIFEIAAESYIQSMSKSKQLSTLSHPYSSSLMLGHESKEVQLVQGLLSCAERVGKKDYQSAGKLLEECGKLSSPTGTPIERVVFYFIEALRAKIDDETGKETTKGKTSHIDLEKLNCTKDMSLLEFYKKHPLAQITRFSGIQAVVDHVAEARKIHVIDLEIRGGLQCTILMQALAAQRRHPSQHLKITTFGTKASRPMIEETCMQLMAFAKSLGNLNFSYHIVMVENILELSKDCFELDPDEVVAVYAAYSFMNMIGRTYQLDHLMGVISSISPRVVIVTEIEAHFNSPTFTERFVEAMFYYGAFFDSIAESMKNDD